MAKKYRIIQVGYTSGDIRYEVQQKHFWGWKTIREDGGFCALDVLYSYPTLEQAQTKLTELRTASGGRFVLQVMDD